MKRRLQARWRAVLTFSAIAWVVLAVGAATTGASQQERPPAGGRETQVGDGQRPVFRTAVDLVDLDATVTDASGHFVSRLRKDDFEVFEDGKPRPVTHFTSERVPVSLGLVVDTSQSMSGARMNAAREALNQVLSELLDPRDETFLYTFSSEPVLVQAWTTRRDAVRDALRHVSPEGGTALFDATAEAVRFAETGHYRKKAVIVISDGNDTTSRTSLAKLGRLVQESDVMVYAIGIDTSLPASKRPTPPDSGQAPTPPLFPPRDPIGPGRGGIGGRPPFPGPGGRDPRGPLPPAPPRAPVDAVPRDDPADVEALRGMTDDTGGRTEIVRTADDLGPATGGIVGELSRQYYLGFTPAAPRDGRWHTIELVVKDRAYHVRARRGYVAGRPE